MILKITGGNLKNNWFIFNHVKKLKDGKEYTVEIKAVRKIRSISQNRYYWGVVVPIIGLELGYDKDDTHEILARNFIPKTITLPSGEELELAQSTTGLSTAEFARYVDQIILFAGQTLGIGIPLPGEVYEDTLATLHNRVEQSLNT